MRALELDYQAKPRRARLAVVALAAGVLAIGAGLAELQYWRQHAAVLQSELSFAQGKVSAAKSQDAVPRTAVDRTDEVRAANTLIRQLNLPWTELFNALEQATTEEIALLGIDPDARKSTVNLTAEAKTDKAMLSYLRRLQQADLFSDAVLQKHEVQLQDVERPLKFTVTATWRQRE